MANIKIQNLKKSFGETIAVDIPSFEINAGDMLGLVGNNGAGKTTLFRLMLDLLQADDGQISMKFANGVSIDPSKSEEWKHHTGAYIDDAFLIDFLTPEEYFQFVAQASDIPAADAEERIKRYEHFMQGEVLGQKKLIRDLSAGNKQKVGIVGAMLSQPDLLILDEPFNYLDPSSQITVARLIRQMKEQLGTTVVISSHNLSFVSEISTRILLLEKGRVIKDLGNQDGSATQELEQYFNTAEQ